MKIPFNPPKKTRLCIGIDPGKHTGFGVWDKATRQLVEVETLGIIAAMALADQYAQDFGKDSILFYLENVPLAKVPKKERLRGVGSVNRDFQIWKEFFETRGYDYYLVDPRQKTRMFFSLGIKTFRKDKKPTAKSFRELTGWTGKKVDDHAREAALFVYKR